MKLIYLIILSVIPSFCFALGENSYNTILSEILGSISKAPSSFNTNYRVPNDYLEAGLTPLNPQNTNTGRIQMERNLFMNVNECLITPQSCPGYVPNITKEERDSMTPDEISKYDAEKAKSDVIYGDKYKYGYESWGNLKIDKNQFQNNYLEKADPLAVAQFTETNMHGSVKDVVECDMQVNAAEEMKYENNPEMLELVKDRISRKEPARVITVSQFVFKNTYPKGTNKADEVSFLDTSNNPKLKDGTCAISNPRDTKTGYDGDFNRTSVHNGTGMVCCKKADPTGKKCIEYVKDKLGDRVYVPVMQGKFTGKTADKCNYGT